MVRCTSLLALVCAGLEPTAAFAFAPVGAALARHVDLAPTYRGRRLPATEEQAATSVETVKGEADDEACVVPEEMSETQQLMQKVKDAGLAGVISYAVWELGFWTLSVPVCVVGYREVTGHWPDLSNQDDLSKLGAEAFAFVNFARFAVPLRIGLALGTTPWIQENIVDRFVKKEAEENICTPEEIAAIAAVEGKEVDGTLNGEAKGMGDGEEARERKGIVARLLRR